MRRKREARKHKQSKIAKEIVYEKTTCSIRTIPAVPHIRGQLRVFCAYVLVRALPVADVVAGLER